MKYHSVLCYALTDAGAKTVNRIGTVSGGQFKWGTSLLKSNGVVY
jgi:hypothetical protein